MSDAISDRIVAEIEFERKQKGRPVHYWDYVAERWVPGRVTSVWKDKFECWNYNIRIPEFGATVRGVRPHRIKFLDEPKPQRIS